MTGNFFQRLKLSKCLKLKRSLRKWLNFYENKAKQVAVQQGIDQHQRHLVLTETENSFNVLQREILFFLSFDSIHTHSSLLITRTICYSAHFHIAQLKNRLIGSRLLLILTETIFDTTNSTPIHFIFLLSSLGRNRLILFCCVF